MLQWCRLQEKEGKMEILCLRVLKAQTCKLTLGAVSGSMLYLTRFANPLYGALLGVDLSRPDSEETVSAGLPPHHHAWQHLYAGMLPVLDRA